MNKKIIALLIVVGVIVGGYASYYAYATTVLMPEDLKVFKGELEVTSGPMVPESEITTMENSADMIEKYDGLSLVPQSERNTVADQLIGGTENITVMMKEFDNNLTLNRNIAMRYDLLFKGDVGNEIRLIYDNDTLNLAKQLESNVNKQAEDIRKGDSKAYANDLRESAKLFRQFNAQLEEAHNHLQILVNKLGG